MGRGGEGACTPAQGENEKNEAGGCTGKHAACRSSRHSEPSLALPALLRLLTPVEPVT
jgi:hypothetical protein